MNRLDATRRAQVVQCLIEARTPAVKAGITDHIWTVEEIIGLLEAVEPKSTGAASSN